MRCQKLALPRAGAKLVMTGPPEWRPPPDGRSQVSRSSASAARSPFEGRWPTSTCRGAGRARRAGARRARFTSAPDHARIASPCGPSCSAYSSYWRPPRAHTQRCRGGSARRQPTLRARSGAAPQSRLRAWRGRGRDGAAGARRTRSHAGSTDTPEQELLIRCLSPRVYPVPGRRRCLSPSAWG
jgi:hypothetical protein